MFGISLCLSYCDIECKWVHVSSNSSPSGRGIPLVSGALQCGSVVEWLGCWTCNEQIVGLNPVLPCRLQPRAVVNMHVSLSPSSIIWYQPMGGNALRLGRHLASHWPHITDISGSLSAGSRPRRGKFWYIAVYLRNCPRLQIPRMFMTLFCPKTTVFEYCCFVYGRAIFLKIKLHMQIINMQWCYFDFWIT